MNTPTEITVSDILDAIAELEGNNAVKFTPIIEATDGVGTNPIDRAYWGICHTDIKRDISNLSDFTGVKDYPRRDSIQSEFGAVKETRWVYSTEASKSSDAIPVYDNFIMGQNAYVIADIDEVATEMIIKPLGFGEDYLNQRQTMGFKAMFGAGIVNDGWIINLRTTKAA